MQSSIKPGQTAQWVVSAWTVQGNVTDAALNLSATPVGQTPDFSFGCGSFDGSASCDLGAVFSGSAERQVIASITVPTTATSVTSVKLTVAGASAQLVRQPSVSIPVAVSQPGATTSPSTSPSSTGSTAGGTGTGSNSSSSVTQLPVGTLPTIGGSGGGTTSSLSPGGNAAGLFPTLNPSSVPSPGPGGSGGSGTPAKPVANTEALPIGTPVVDAQLVGLAALGLAFLLAVTRMSVRRRPASAAAGAGKPRPAASGNPAGPASSALATAAAVAGTEAPASSEAVSSASPATAQPWSSGSAEPATRDESSNLAGPTISGEAASAGGPPTMPQPDASDDQVDF